KLNSQKLNAGNKAMRIILPRPVIKAGSGVLNFALFAFPLWHFPGNRFVFLLRSEGRACL
ncbi:hypothetical protein, partial [Leclercia adecarboxylata]|uniref:hypothetical protein n=1 Tax=Leclercia adecarboxylata TaxID=83655 RepID=UPI001C37A534